MEIISKKLIRFNKARINYFQNRDILVTFDEIDRFNQAAEMYHDENIIKEFKCFCNELQNLHDNITYNDICIAFMMAFEVIVIHEYSDIPILRDFYKHYADDCKIVEDLYMIICGIYSRSYIDTWENEDSEILTECHEEHELYSKIRQYFLFGKIENPNIWENWTKIWNDWRNSIILNLSFSDVP
jgi:hypothetical protein